MDMVHRRPSPIGRNRQRRGASLTAGLAVLALIVSSVAVLGGSASPNLHPPFRHSVAAFSPQTYTSGACTSIARVSGMAWNASSGGVNALATSKALGCSTPPFGPGTGGAVAEADITVALPISVAAGGHNFTEGSTWSLLLTTTARGTVSCPKPHLTPGQPGARGCNFQTSVDTWWGFDLYDATNGSTLQGAYSGTFGPRAELDQSNTTQCTASGTCTTTGSSSNCSGYPRIYGICVPSGRPTFGNASFWLNTSRNCVSALGKYCYLWQNWTLVSTHKYWILADFTLYSAVTQNDYAKGIVCLASAGSSSPGGAAWKLTSITVR